MDHYYLTNCLNCINEVIALLHKYQASRDEADLDRALELLTGQSNALVILLQVG